MIEVFQHQTIFIVFKSVCYIWIKQKCLDEGNKNRHRNHKVLSGHWHTIDLSEQYGKDVTPLAIMYIDDQNCSCHWSLLFLSQSEESYQIFQQTFKFDQATGNWRKNLKKASPIVDIKTSKTLKSKICIYSPCGQLCVISLQFLDEKSKLYLVHLSVSKIHVQDLANEISFLSDDESVKCVEFICKGIHSN